MAVKFTLIGAPRTKKNSQRIVNVGNHPKILPSKEYLAYEADCLKQLWNWGAIAGPVNVKCVYYMPTRRRVDLVNLLEATDDILVRAGILADDNSTVISGHDGSRVRYDKENPRVEITIGGQEDDNP